MRKTILYGIAFISGAVVLALEILAGRFLQPKFGATVRIWGNLIAVVLAGLSIGYYLGGQIADRRPSFRAFAVLLFSSAALLLALPLYATAVRDAIFNAVDVESVEGMGSLLASSALFLAPTIVLGMVSPYAVRLLADDRSKLGRQVGSLYALSTLGSIVGAIGTTFFLVVHVGLRDAFFVFGIVQAALGTVALAYGLFGHAEQAMERADRSTSAAPDANPGREDERPCGHHTED